MELHLLQKVTFYGPEYDGCMMDPLIPTSFYITIVQLLKWRHGIGGYSRVRIHSKPSALAFLRLKSTTPFRQKLSLEQSGVETRTERGKPRGKGPILENFRTVTFFSPFQTDNLSRPHDNSNRSSETKEERIYAGSSNFNLRLQSNQLHDHQRRIINVNHLDVQSFRTE